MAGSSNYQETLRCALVTGSSNGIGEAVVKALAAKNYKVVVTGRDRDDIRRVADECTRLSPGRIKVSVWSQKVAGVAWQLAATESDDSIPRTTTTTTD